MTIQELFEEMRKEPDWSKEVVIFKGYDVIPVNNVVPNIMNDEQFLLEVKET